MLPLGRLLAGPPSGRWLGGLHLDDLRGGCGGAGGTEVAQRACEGSRRFRKGTHPGTASAETPSDPAEVAGAGWLGRGRLRHLVVVEHEQVNRSGTRVS